jgi:hypothetical protein
MVNKNIDLIGVFEESERNKFRVPNNKPQYAQKHEDWSAVSYLWFEWG